MAALKQERSAGACRGVFGLDAAIADGVAAGEAAARDAVGGGIEAAHPPVPLSTDLGAGRLEPLPHPRSPRRRVKAFVDFQNDVTAKDVKLAVREGFRSIEHIKRYTTTGMATDQGKTSNMNALGIAASALDKPLPAVGLTTFRMPYTPVTFGAFAGAARGELFDPARPTPTHDWASAKGGRVSRTSGQWKRASLLPAQAARTCIEPSRGNVRRCANRSAFSMPRRSARSRSSGPTPPSS